MKFSLAFPKITYKLRGLNIFSLAGGVFSMFNFRSCSTRKTLSTTCFRMVVALVMMMGIPLSLEAGPVTTLIEASIDNGASWKTLASGVDSASNPLITVGNFTFTQVQAFGFDNPADLSSSTFHLTHNTSGTDKILIAVTSSGFTSPTTPPNVTMTSSVSGTNNLNFLSGLSFQSWANDTVPNPTDHKAETGSLTTGLQTGFPITGSFNNSVDTTLTTLTSPFTLSHLYTVTMTGSGFVVALGGETSLTQTPEPATITLLGVGIAGMAGYGWRKRKQSVTA
jgi:PEP-CTERM motif